MASRYGLTIRAADEGDLAGVAELLRICGLAVPRNQLASSLSLVRQQPGVLLLAEEWGPPTGLIALHWATALIAGAKVAYLDELLVAPDRRRAGVARLLLKAGSQAARAAGCGELILTAGAGDDGLLDFALATGFSHQGERLRRPLRKQG